MEEEWLCRMMESLSIGDDDSKSCSTCEIHPRRGLLEQLRANLIRYSQERGIPRDT
jgi:hypothetical protein